MHQDSWRLALSKEQVLDPPALGSEVCRDLPESLGDFPWDFPPERSIGSFFQKSAMKLQK
jgi:hypothetical protein